MNASVKDNICFGHRFDSVFYEKTVKACALTEDFAQLPDGDETEVGERGISLSGGQKARLTLARAVYARADVYLLDDCLSAVDQHVGRHLIENVFGPTGLLSGKTRILATNSIPVLMEADFICLIRDGKIIERGTYDQLIAMKGEISNLIKTASSQDQSTSNSPSPSDTSESSTMTERPEDDQEKDEAEEAQETLSQLQPIRAGGTGTKLRKSDIQKYCPCSSFDRRAAITAHSYLIPPSLRTHADEHCSPLEAPPPSSICTLEKMVLT